MINQKSSTSIVKPWVPVLAWAGVIFAFSCMPTVANVGIIWWDFIIKKTAHMVEFGILTILLYRAIRLTFTKIKEKSLLFYSFLWPLLYAFSDEFHQRFTPGRTSTIRDVGFDLAGILIGLYLITKLSEDKTRYKKIYKFIFK